MDGVIAIIRTNVKQGDSIEHRYEAKKFRTQEEAKTLCSSKTHETIIGFYDCEYKTARKVADKINKLDNSKKEAAEKGLDKILRQQP